MGMPDERDDDPEDLELPPSFFPYGNEEDRLVRQSDLGEPVEVTVEGVFYAESNNNVQRFVLLSSGEKKLAIVIGLAEATSISLPLEGNQPDRPMTHDLMKVIVERLEAEVTRILIDDIWNKTYYAKVYLTFDGEEMEVDARPSDAIAIALRWDVPIYVLEGIFDRQED